MENARGDPILMEGTVLISFIDFILFFQIITILRFKVIIGAKHPNSLITRWWWRRNLFHPLCRNVSGDRKEKRAYGIMNTKKEIIFFFAVGRKGKANKMFVFYIPPYFLWHPFTTTPPKMRKRNLHHFLNFVFSFWKHRIYINFESWSCFPFSTQRFLESKYPSHFSSHDALFDVMPQTNCLQYLGYIT